ncbi:MAG: prolyl oligopeptidase family serine peptidase [Pseudomonadota bacterium]
MARFPAFACLACLCAAALFVSAVPAADAKGEACDRDCRIKKAERLLTDEIKALSNDLGDVSWSADGRVVYYISQSEGRHDFVKADVTARTQHRLVDRRRLSDAIEKRYGDAVPRSAFKTRAIGYDAARSRLTVSVDGFSYIYNLNTGALRRRKQEAKNTRESLSPSGRYAIYTQDGDLYRRAIGGRGAGEARRLSFDAEQWRSFAAEAAISNPLDLDVETPRAPYVTWIGEGPYFFIERWDNRNVGEAWIVETQTKGRPRLRTQKFAYPGEPDENLPQPELWIFNADTGAGFEVDAAGWAHIGNMDMRGGGIYPSRDGTRVYFARMSRGYDDVELCVVDIASREMATLLREPAEPSSSLRFAEFHETPDGFIWKSDRDGYLHYYLHDRRGALVRQLTRGAFSVDRILHVDHERNAILASVYGDASEENPYHRHIIDIDMQTGAMRRLGDAAADHRIWPSPDGAYFVERTARVDMAPRLVVKDRSGAEIMKLAETSTERLETLGWTPPTPVEVRAADGDTPLFGVMWTPSDFDPSRTYPVISYVYPGPQGEPAPFGRFNPADRNSVLAELGFVTVALGQRGGASMRGRAYQHYPRAFGDMRDYGLADNKAGLEKLIERHGFMDASRIGVYGHSGGGFMAVAAMLRHPEFYKVGVAGAGNHDNNIYEMNSGEFFFGHPYSGPAGGAAGFATNQDVADRLKGKLLLVHGDEDRDVHIAHTLRLLRAFMEAGKKVDLVILPGEGHGYASEGQGPFSDAAATYYRLRRWDYFLEHLAGTPMDGVDLGAP